LVVEVHETVDQVLVFVTGSGQSVVGEETQDIGAGDLFTVPAGTEHNFINTGDDVMKLFTGTLACGRAGAAAVGCR